MLKAYRWAGLIAGVILSLLLGRTGVVGAAVFPIGEVMVSIGSGQVQVHKPDGSIDTSFGTNGILDDGSGTFTTGSAFDSNGNFFVTDFNGNRVSKYDPSGNLLGTFGSGYSSDESILFDATGNAFVGNVGSGNLFKFDASGNLLATFLPAQNRIDWIDLAADQCTILYTTEGVEVFAFDVCTNMDLPNFNVAALPGSNAFALRILPSGGVLIADSTEVTRLDSSGNQIQHYTFAGETLLFALNLDPDGTSFWTADFGTSDVLKVDIASGNTLLKFNTGSAADTVFGVSVKGEITVGGQPTATVAVSPPPTSVSGGPGQTVNLGTFTLTNTSDITETFTSVTINLSQPLVLSQLSVSGTFDESSTSGQTNSPSASNVITLSTPVQLTGGAVANFTVQGKIAGGTTAAVVGGGGFAMAAIANSGSPGSGTSSGTGSRFGLGLVLLMMLIAASLKLRPPMRTSLIAAVAIVGLMGCDPCSHCAEGTHHKTMKTSTVTLQAVTGTDAEETAVTVTGVPTPLNTVTKT